MNITEKIILAVSSKADLRGFDQTYNAIAKLEKKLTGASGALKTLLNVGSGDAAKVASAMDAIGAASTRNFAKFQTFEKAGKGVVKTVTTEFAALGEEIQKTFAGKFTGQDPLGVRRTVDNTKKAVANLRKELAAVGATSTEVFNKSVGASTDPVARQRALVQMYNQQAKDLALIARTNETLVGNDAARLRVMQQAEAARSREVSAEQKLASLQKQTRDDQIRSRVDTDKALHAAGGKAQKLRDKDEAGQRSHAERVRSQQQKRLDNARALAAVQNDFDSLAGAGYTVGAPKVTGASGRGTQYRRVTEQSAFRDDAGIRTTQRLRLETDQSGKVVGANIKVTEQATKAAEKFDDANRFIGRNLLTNIKHVTAWTAAVGVLYGTLGLLKRSVGTIAELEYATARLRQVFRGGDADARRLADGVIHLAAANGRSSQEAMESAIQWSRLGLNRVQVLEAVRVSLMAANVAEITAAQATDHLSSLMQVYGLRVGELNSVLGMANSMSNTYNVTNRQLFEGLTRVSAIAKQAGMSLAELMAVVSAGVGSTGQTGPNIANALKSVIGSMANPDKQKFLRDKFKFEVTIGGGGDMKNFSALLGDMFVKYQQLNAAEKQSMLFNIAGKFQASRMAAILDSYVKAQVLAVQAQLNLNSAEQENALITATLRSQFQGLVTEWERFAKVQGTHGVGQALTQVTKTFRGVLSVMNEFPVVTTGLIGLFAALAARIAVTSVQMDRAGKSGGIFINSFAAISDGVKGLRLAAIHMLAQVPWLNAWARGTTEAALASGAAIPKVNALRAAIATLGITLATVGKWFAVVALVVGGFNAAIDVLGYSTDRADKHLQKGTQAVEAATKAYQAAAQAVQFYDTARAALGVSRNEGKQREILQGVGTIAGSIQPSQQGRIEGEIKVIERIADAKKRLAATTAFIEKVKTDAEEFGLRKRMEARAKEAESIAKLEYEIEKLRGSHAGRLGLNKKQVADLESKLEDERQKRTSGIIRDLESQDESYRSFLESDQLHLNYLERQREVLGAISHLYDSIPAFGEADRGVVNIAKFGALKQMTDAALNRVDQELDELRGKDLLPSALDQQMIERKNRAEEMQQQVEKWRMSYEDMVRTVADPVGIFPNALVDRTQGIGEFDKGRAMRNAPAGVLGAQEEAERLRREMDEIKARKARIPAADTARATRLQGEADQLRKDLARFTAQESAAKAALPVLQFQQQESFSRSVFQARADSFATGNDYQALLAQRRELERQLGLGTTRQKPVGRADLQARREAAGQRGLAIKAELDAAQQELARLKKEREVQDAYMGEHDGVSPMAGDIGAAQRRVAELKARYAAANQSTEAAQAAINAALSPEEKRQNLERLKQNAQEAVETSRKAYEDAKRQQANTGFDQPDGVNLDAGGTARALKEYREAQQRLAAVDRDLAAAGPTGASQVETQADRQNQLNELMVYEQTLQKNRLQIATQYYDLQKKIHDEQKAYAKLLAGQGPGELLRTLALNRLTRTGRMTGGAFWASAPGARSQMMGDPNSPFNPDSARNQRAQIVRDNPDWFKKGANGRFMLGADGFPILDPESAKKQNAEGTARLAEYAKKYGLTLPKEVRDAAGKSGGSNEISEAAKAAATQVRGFGEAVAQATTTLIDMIKRLGGGQKPNTYSGPPRTPASPVPAAPSLSPILPDGHGVDPWGQPY